MKEKLDKTSENPTTFLDEIWPLGLPQTRGKKQQGDKPISPEDDEELGLTELKKWRIQTLLAISGWGIPSTVFAEAYEKMFGKKFVIKEFGFNRLEEMVNELPEIFAIQEPDEVTALLFPDYPHDKILHDTRFGLDFKISPRESLYETANHDYRTLDWDQLISYAWLNRDDDFPKDVVLAGETYKEYILPLTEGKVDNSNGIFKAIMIGAANPEHIYLNIKNENTERVSQLSLEVKYYFDNLDSNLSLDMYRIPDEFIYPGYPCLIYIDKEDSWERGSIIAKTDRDDRIIVETVDYGSSLIVSRLNLYMMPKKFFDFPSQSLLVSMIGAKPNSESGKWSRGSGARTRCFSYPNYYLDCLLLDVKSATVVTEKVDDEDPQSSLEIDKSTIKSNADIDLSRKSKFRRSLKKMPKYDVIICDRNEEHMDLYLDDVLVVETYAVVDDKRDDEIKNYKKLLKKAFESVPRPKNSMIGRIFGRD